MNHTGYAKELTLVGYVVEGGISNSWSLVNEKTVKAEDGKTKLTLFGEEFEGAVKNGELIAVTGLPVIERWTGPFGDVELRITLTNPKIEKSGDLKCENIETIKNINYENPIAVDNFEGIVLDFYDTIAASDPYTITGWVYSYFHSGLTHEDGTFKDVTISIRGNDTYTAQRVQIEENSADEDLIPSDKELDALIVSKEFKTFIGKFSGRGLGNAKMEK